MIVYLAGPMRGHPDLNFPAFDHAAARIRLHTGATVISPAAIDLAYGFDPRRDPVTREVVLSCIRRDVEAITQADAVVVLPGWEDSRGASAEVAVAEWAGLPWYTLEDFLSEGVDTPDPAA